MTDLEKSPREKLKKPEKPTLLNDLVLKNSLKTHGFIFSLTNLLLFLLNLFFSPTMIWFIFPLFGWFIGLALHSMAVILRKVKPIRKALILHGTVFASTMLFLSIINILINQALTWSLFPIFFWGFGLAAHAGLVFLYKPQIKSQSNNIGKGITGKTKLIDEKKRINLMRYSSNITSENEKLEKFTTQKVPMMEKKPSNDIESKLLDDQTLEELKKTESEVEVKKQHFTCIVHKGSISGANIYLCPHCNTIYCIKCAKTLKKNGERCWVCENNFEV